MFSIMQMQVYQWHTIFAESGMQIGYTKKRVTMMDVNKLRKINQLSATLRKHGLAANNEEAVQMAGDIEGPHNSQEFSDVIKQCDNMAKSEKASYEAENEAKMSRMEEKSKGFSEEQFIKVMQKFADQFSEEINNMRKRMDMQDNMIKQMSKSNSQSMQEHSPKHVQYTNEEQAVKEIIEERENESNQTVVIHEEPSQIQVHHEMKAPESHSGRGAPEPRTPRSGNYKPNDVSIDKFFYYGNK
jgi:hypothetical protein